MTHSSSDVAVYLPCRAGSQRVKDKNLRCFAGVPGGLLQIKLEQLARLEGVARIYLDSNDPRVLEVGRVWQSRWNGHGALVVNERPDRLGQSDTTTDELIRYALELVCESTLMWTHVTAPLVTDRSYEVAMQTYRELDRESYDSLMSVKPLRNFVWTEHRPVNYRREPIRWPRTQDLDPVYEVTSGIFMVDTKLGRELGDRIGGRPYLMSVSQWEALDIDWEEDFRFAELVYRAQHQ